MRPQKLCCHYAAKGGATGGGREVGGQIGGPFFSWWASHLAVKACRRPSPSSTPSSCFPSPQHLLGPPPRSPQIPQPSSCLPAPPGHPTPPCPQTPESPHPISCIPKSKALGLAGPGDGGRPQGRCCGLGHGGTAPSGGQMADHRKEGAVRPLPTDEGAWLLFVCSPWPVAVSGSLVMGEAAP